MLLKRILECTQLLLKYCKEDEAHKLNITGLETGWVKTICFSFGYIQDASNAVSSLHEVDGIVDLLQTHFV